MVRLPISSICRPTPTQTLTPAAPPPPATPSRFSTWAVLGKPFTIRVLPDVMKQAVR